MSILSRLLCNGLLLRRFKPCVSLPASLWHKIVWKFQSWRTPAWSTLHNYSNVFTRAHQISLLSFCSSTLLSSAASSLGELLVQLRAYEVFWTRSRYPVGKKRLFRLREGSVYIVGRWGRGIGNSVGSICLSIWLQVYLRIIQMWEILTLESGNSIIYGETLTLPCKAY